MTKQIGTKLPVGLKHNLYGLHSTCAPSVSTAFANIYTGYSHHSPDIQKQTSNRIIEEFFLAADYATSINHRCIIAEFITVAGVAVYALYSPSLWLWSSVALATAAGAVAEISHLVQRTAVNVQTDEAGRMLQDAPCLKEKMFERASGRLMEWAKAHTPEDRTPA